MRAIAPQGNRRKAASLVTVGPFAYLATMSLLLPIVAGPHRQLLQFDGAGTFNPLQVAAPDLIDWIQGKDPQAIGHWRDLGADEYGRAYTPPLTDGLQAIHLP